MDRPKILIVEDESIVARDIRARLEEMQYVVVGSVDTGEAAVELAREANPDLVLMDIRLSGEMDGTEAAGIIHGQSGVPVVYLTAYGDDATVENGKVGAPFGWILKPFENRDLRAGIETALNRYRLESALRLEKEAHQAAERRYRFLYDQSPAIHVAIRSDGRISDVNPALIDIIGTGRDELVGRHLMELVEPQHAGHVVQFLDDVFEGTCEEYLEVGVSGADGLSHTILFSPGRIVPAGSSDGIACLVSGIEITERKRTAAALEQARKRVEQMARMRTIGSLAAGFAHHFNNLLTIVRGNAEFLLTARPDGGELADGVLQIVDAARRAEALTGQLMAYGRSGLFQSAAINLNEITRSVAGSVQPEISSSICLHLNLCDEPVDTVGDPNQVYHALLNLMLNACQAMPFGGELVVGVERVTLTEAQCKTIPHDVSPGPFVRISVCDTGIGMDEETRRRVFEPFFTTKESSDSVGMGLASVYGCVSNHHGSVDIVSQPGEGTTVSILLPLVAPPDKAPAAGRARP